MDAALARHFLDDVTVTFRKLKKLADAALAQVDDAAFFRLVDAESNSLALIVKHVAGNQRSRWRDFLTTDGEKADRHRDTEFEAAGEDGRASLMLRWEEGWRLLFDALAVLAPDDLLREVQIRGEAHTVMQAIQRQLVHYGQHVGQIVFLAKHWAGAEWKTLSIPRGRSAEYLAAHGVALHRPKEGG